MYTNEKYRMKIITSLLPYAKGVKKIFAVSFVLSLLITTLNFLEPLVYKVFIDKVIVAGNMRIFTFVLISYFAILISRILIGYGKNYTNYRMNNQLLYMTKYKIFKDLFRCDFSSFERLNVGEVKMGLENDVECVVNFPEQQITNYTISTITLIISLIFIFLISWKLSLVAIITIPVTMYIDHLLSLNEKIVINCDRDNEEEMTSWLNVSMRNWKEIKALNLESYEKRQYAKFLHRFAIINSKKINYFVARCIVIPWMKEKLFMQLLIYSVGGVLVIKGELTIGLILVFAQYYRMLSLAVQNVSTSNAELMIQSPIFDRLLKKLEVKSVKDLIRPASDSSEIVLKDVSYAYAKGEKNVLKNVNLSVKRGDKVAIYGKSGQGKSTLVKLMTGLCFPTKGRITFSEVPVEEIDSRYLFSKIGFMMQDSVLFNTSITENMLLANPDATSEDIEIACRKAMIYDHIIKLPEKFDTVLGENAVNLSGGQRQRLILARQLLRNVDVLIFDEATSSLDHNSEDAIYEALSNMDESKIVIFITHGTSGIAIANRRLRISDGNVTEETLLEK